MAERKPKAPVVMEIAKIETTTQTFPILGKRPIILNRLSEKAKNELLSPAGRKTSAQKQMTLKHNPYEEFRASPYTLKEATAPTFLAVMSSGFKAAMATAALDLPGAKKAQIGRLVWVEDTYTPLYGLPYLDMKPVRSSDMNHTPDIRTRAMVKEWACLLRVTFVESLIKLQGILNLLAAAGLTVGVGDWRNEKGKGTYGQFEVVNHNDPRFASILATGGREAQKACMDEPAYADEETREMLEWWENATKQRGFLLGEDEDEAPGEDEEAAAD